MSVLETIRARRSVREFNDQNVSDEQIEQILETGRWAPSGLNNQPWRFVVIRNLHLKEQVAECTSYKRTIREANVLIAVFLDTNVMYDRTKDVQAIGACIQNMLLAIHDLGLGACWMGEILNRREEVEKLLKVPESFELMVILAIGYPRPRARSSSRRSLTELIQARFD
jgi:nitroreductase